MLEVCSDPGGAGQRCRGRDRPALLRIADNPHLDTNANIATLGETPNAERDAAGVDRERGWGVTR